MKFFRKLRQKIGDATTNASVSPAPAKKKLVKGKPRSKFSAIIAAKKQQSY